MLVLIMFVAVSSLSAETIPKWAAQLDLAESLVKDNRMGEAEGLFEGAQKMADELGRGELASGLSAYRLGHYHFQIGKLMEAERDYLHASEVFDSRLGAGHRVAVDTIIQLSSTYLELEEIAKAGALLNRRLEAAPEMSPGDRGALLGNFGAVLMYQGRFSESERTYRRALQIFEGDSRTESRERMAIAYSNLSGICLRSNRISEALELAERANSLLEALPSPPPTLAVKTIANLATIHASAGKDPRATDLLFGSAVRLCETNFGPNHFLLGRLLANYADFLQGCNRKDEAKAARKRANSILASFQKANRLGATVDVSILRTSSSRLNRQSAGAAR